MCLQDQVSRIHQVQGGGFTTPAVHPGSVVRPGVIGTLLHLLPISKWATGTHFLLGCHSLILSLVTFFCVSASCTKGKLCLRPRSPQFTCCASS
jgi:hypothetical protein